MDHNDQDAKNRIIQAAAEILGETADIDRITVRQIAERAKVGIGLINYHFKTKDNLLSITVGDAMAKMADGFIASGNYPGLEPVPKIKAMLKALFNYAEQYEKLLRFTVTHSVLNGDMQAQLFLIPILREIFGSQKDEIQLRIIAMQMLLPLQVTGIAPAAFRLYSGIDLYNESQRNDFIDTLVDNLVGLSY